MARIISERNSEFASRLADNHVRLLQRRIDDLTRERVRAERNATILLALNAVVPLSASSYYELVGDVSIEFASPDDAVTHITALRAAGYVFDDAEYSHAYHEERTGIDYVNVVRRVTSVEGDAEPLAVGVVRVQWTAEFDPASGGKCRIVESTSTYRSLVCNSLTE